MKQLLPIQLSLIFGFLSCVNLYGQEINVDAGSYGIDKKNKIIVWHQTNLDSIIAANKGFTKIKFDESFTVNDPAKVLSYSEMNLITNGDQYKLYISKIPLIHITIDTSAINSKSKIPGHFTFFNKNKYIESTIGVRHRGNTSLAFPKKSYDLEFWNDSISKEKKDVKFKGMRSDDDWILDAMYNEPLRLRSYIATNLWAKINKPYYAQKEPKAKSGFDVEYVEVFRNNEYYGIYQLSESIDRKQLKLKKNAGKTINGELYKASTYKGGPSFTKAPDTYNNLYPHWNGWEIQYPFIEYQSDWENLSKFENLVVNSTNEKFSKTIEKELLINNVIDYYLLINMLRATDNLTINYYLAKYDKDEPYFFVPWDLDGVWGVIQDGKHERITSDILGNGLFEKLMLTNPNGYKAKVKSRWASLRTNEFSNEALLSRINKIYKNFTKQKVYEREQLVWDNKVNNLSNKEQYDYLKTWLEERLIFLDTHFESF